MPCTDDYRVRNRILRDRPGVTDGFRPLVISHCAATPFRSALHVKVKPQASALSTPSGMREVRLRVNGGLQSSVAPILVQENQELAHIPAILAKD